MKEEPLVSFCIATYKRPSMLKESIRSALTQTYPNIEIVVADNDPAQSGKAVVSFFNSKKIFYIHQKQNVGMIKNFNTAFSHSHGDYIVFAADDDPFEPQMVEWCMEMRKKFPKAGSYFGAPFLLAYDPIILQLHKLKKGKTSLRNKHQKEGAIRLLTPSQFLPAFLNYEIFDYFLWSCGMVRRDIVKLVNGFQDLYGSNFLTDFAYILRVGFSAPMVTMNREFGSQRIHENNFGRSDTDLLTLKQAVRGLYELCEPQAKQSHCEQDLRKFTRNWVKGQLQSVLRFRKMTGQAENRSFFIKLYFDLASSYSFFRPGIPEFLIRIYFPRLAKLYDDYKWIFEKRTIRRGIKKLLFFPTRQDNSH